MSNLPEFHIDVDRFRFRMRFKSLFAQHTYVSRLLSPIISLGHTQEVDLISSSEGGFCRMALSDQSRRSVLAGQAEARQKEHPP
jgi:hypothetical protein